MALRPILAALFAAAAFFAADGTAGGGYDRADIELAGGPHGVAWVVQLSDLHFSSHHPDRAYDFRRYVAPALAIVNPALVLITGDLTDGKSKDFLTMKQDEVEWVEYEKAINDVSRESRLPRRIFYDLRGNHDSFGVPAVGGSYDFYSTYSVNAKEKRAGRVQSITLGVTGQKYQFVGFDSAMEIGLRGPTNIFGHPTDQLLKDIDSALSQWDTGAAASPVTKVTFGHFTMSFSAATESGRTLKDVFLNQSVSAYVCGHLHTRFGKNLKRHYFQSLQHQILLDQFFQFSISKGAATTSNWVNCSGKSNSVKEFWEWEMGDWRKSRSMRILAIDSGNVVYTDVDFKLGSKSIIIVPTFPLDSRFMQMESSAFDFECKTKRTVSFDAVRALVFSKHKIVLVTAKIYDSCSGKLDLVLDSEMMKLEGNNTRGDMYVVGWNWRAFADASAERYWLQIVATDITGDTRYSQLRPFSINGLISKVNWTPKEFLVMGCQWAAIFYPALWSAVVLIFMLLLAPRLVSTCLNMQFTYRYLDANFSRSSALKNLVYAFFWSLTELSRMTVLWSGLLFYMIYLLIFPWFFGYALTEDGRALYMTPRGWVLKRSSTEVTRVGVPDVMVVVLPHICYVVLPTVVVLAALIAERMAYTEISRALSGKKEDDRIRGRKRCAMLWRGRWIRKLLVLFCLLIFWKHWKQCRALVKAYAMNPFQHSPVFCFFIPFLMVFAIYSTSN